MHTHTHALSPCIQQPGHTNDVDAPVKLPACLAFCISAGGHTALDNLAASATARARAA